MDYQAKAMSIIDFVTGVQNEETTPEDPKSYFNSIPLAQLPFGFAGLNLPNVVVRAAASRLVGIASNATYGLQVPALKETVWKEEHEEACKLLHLLREQAPGIEKEIRTYYEGKQKIEWKILPTEKELESLLIKDQQPLHHVFQQEWMHNLMGYIYTHLYKQMYDAADCEMRIVMGQGSDNASVGKQFLKVTPKDATTLTPDEFQHAVKRVLGKDTYGSDEVCALCKLAGGNSVGHLVKCKKVSGTTRHDTMVDIIADALKLINPVRTETLTAPRENKRRMDIRMDHNGKIIWCDVSITSEFQQSCMDEAARKRPKPHMKALDKRHKEK